MIHSLVRSLDPACCRLCCDLAVRNGGEENQNNTVQVRSNAPRIERPGDVACCAREYCFTHTGSSVLFLFYL